MALSRKAIVIGGGPGGYSAALHLGHAGIETTLVSDERAGGTCLLRGCVPTKTLLETAQLLRRMRSAQEFGVISSGDATVDLAAVRARQAKIVSGLSGGLEQLLAGARVTRKRGRGFLLPGPDLRVLVRGEGEETLAGDAVVLAVGSQPALPPVPGMDLSGVFSSDGALGLEQVPERLGIIGGGAIGCEFAAAFSAFGAQVTIIEALPRLLPGADAEVSGRLATAFGRRGITVVTGAQVLEVLPGPRVRLRTTAGESDLAVDGLLVATGRRPATGGLGLPEAGVVVGSHGDIIVDERFRTSRAGVWAVGDAVAGPMLAHASFAQAALAVADIAGEDLPRIGPIPRPVFCDPEVAWVGQTEEEAGPGAVTIRIPYAVLGKAHVLGQTDGLCKVVTDATGRILGVHYFGPGATELVSLGAFALSAGMTVRQLSELVLPHPTLGEGIAEAALLALGRPLHVPVRRS